MSRRAAIILIASGAWALFVWATRLVNMAGEHRSTGFLVVHTALAVISIGFGVAVALIGYRSWRGPRTTRRRHLSHFDTAR